MEVKGISSDDLYGRVETVCNRCKGTDAALAAKDEEIEALELQANKDVELIDALRKALEASRKETDGRDAEIIDLQSQLAERIVWWHSQLQDVLAEVRALDRVVADDLEAVMNQMWEAKDEVRK